MGTSRAGAATRQMRASLRLVESSRPRRKTRVIDCWKRSSRRFETAFCMRATSLITRLTSSPDGWAAWKRLDWWRIRP
jgi:hypothetical protein